MKLSGEIRICCIDSRNNELVWEYKQSNLIPDNSLVEILDWNSVASYFGLKNISISTSTVEPSAANHTLEEIIATGYIPNNVTSPTWHEGIEPPFGQIQNRINFIGVSRTFNTVGLTDLASSNLQNNLSNTTYAYVKLDVPCTQGEFDFLDIFYRIQFDDFGSQGLTKQARYDFGKRLILGNGNSPQEFRISHLYAFASSVAALGYSNFYAAGIRVAAAFPLLLEGWDSGQRVDSHFKWKGVLNEGLEDSVGIIFNAMAQGVSDTLDCAYSFFKYVYDQEPFQTGFWHSNIATLPFFDPANTGNSNGKIILGGTWAGGFPELYKITITTSGAAGVAQYKFSVRKHLGFVGNSYIDQQVACPYKNPNIAAHLAHHGWREQDNDVLRYSNTKVVQYDQTGVTLLDLVTGVFTTWDSLTAPALTATDIRQCATDGAKIYAACRNTGLWIIDVVANTIARPVTTGCYGVDVGRGSIAYALFNGGLQKSSGWGVALTFNFAGISDGNWNRVQFLKCDPENVSDRLGLVADNGAGVRQIVWWNNANSAAVLGYQGEEIKPWTASLDVSDTGGFWASGSQKLIFGSIAVEAFLEGDTATSKSLTHSLFGNDNYYKVSFYEGNFIAKTQLISSANTSVVNYVPLSESSYVLHLDSGIVLGSTYMTQIFSDNQYCWTNYGWNGSAWVKNNAGGKLTHTADAALLNGLVLKFENATATSHFTSSDYFTQSINWGLLKDNATELYFASQWYSKPAQFDGFATATIPGAPHQLEFPCVDDPDFVVLETNSPELHQFTIAGVAVANIYTAGETPAPGEVTITEEGIATFNPVDAGKTFTAVRYAWVKS